MCILTCAGSPVHPQKTTRMHCCAKLVIFVLFLLCFFLYIRAFSPRKSALSGFVVSMQSIAQSKAHILSRNKSTKRAVNLLISGQKAAFTGENGPGRRPDVSISPTAHVHARFVSLAENSLPPSKDVRIGHLKGFRPQNFDIPRTNFTEDLIGMAFAPHPASTDKIMTESSPPPFWSSRSIPTSLAAAQISTRWILISGDFLCGVGGCLGMSKKTSSSKAI